MKGTHAEGGALYSLQMENMTMGTMGTGEELG
jgi:hypothetical protein